MITLNDFKVKGYSVPMPNTQEAVVGTHHKQLLNQKFGAVEGTSLYGCVYNLKLDPGVDTVFLPYYQDQAASVRLPTHGPRFFITSNLSGCAIYIGKNNNNQLVVIHSNSQKGSDKLTMESNKPSYQSRGAVTDLDLYAFTARNNHGGAVRPVAILTKATYLGSLDARAAHGGSFLAGTTVAGWRQGGTNNWKFWYQVWGSIGGSPVQMLDCKEFYRNY